MKIMVVDDERAIRFSLAELLESEGHEVREAEHAPAALAALDEAPADLVLSDRTKRRCVKPGSRRSHRRGLVLADERNVITLMQYPDVKLLMDKNLLDRITVNPAQCGGRPCIRGYRIRVTDVLDLLSAGLTVDEVLEELENLETEDIQAVMQYTSLRMRSPVLAA